MREYIERWTEVVPGTNLYETLLSIAEGRSMEEIGEDSGVSIACVTGRANRLRQLFGARTTPQLISLAYHYGVLLARRPA